MEVTIVGVDCAADRRDVGLALGRWAGGEARIEAVARGSREQRVAKTIAKWAVGSERTLLALVAPLGWPADLGSTLMAHTAGEPIDVCRKDLFRRETDRFVYCKVGKRPFDVGADKIAHTAHSALKRLEKVRELTGQPIPLAWEPEIGPGIHAIEVYPGATLKAYKIEAPKYKDSREGLSSRRKLIDFLAEHLRLPEDTTPMEDNADALDAGICVLAAVDFLRGHVLKPDDHMPKARKEGWIWVRR